MPTCHRCAYTGPTAELRRTTKGAVCKATTACTRRQRAQKAIERAANLREGEVAHAARAFSQIERLRNSLREGWEAPSMVRLRVAREELYLWLEEHDRGGAR